MLYKCKGKSGKFVRMFGNVGEPRGVAAIATVGSLLGEFYLIITPVFVFALLLIGSSLLTQREG